MSSRKQTAPPGGEAKTEARKLLLMRRTVFNLTGVETQTGEQAKKSLSSSADGICWLEVNQMQNDETFDAIGRQFSIHHLVMEDILDKAQRSKFEEFDDSLFFVLRIPLINNKLTVDKQAGITFEQISWLVGKDWLITFCASDKNLFEPVRERILTGKGRIRSQGTDYLAYALLDLAVDQYFSVLDRVGDALNYLDESLVTRPNPAQLRQIHFIKRQLLYLHKSAWPLREVIGTFERCESGLCKTENRPYIRDVYDHIIQVIDMVETYRDLVAGMLDIYLSSISYRLNEVMKVLTIISTLFIPLTFIVGIYGMNFESMPGLRWEYGFYAISALMLAISLAMLKFFRSKRWI